MADSIHINPAALFGRVITSFQLQHSHHSLSGGMTAFAVHENAADYDVNKKTSIKEKSVSARRNKNVDVAQRTGFDVLRVTFNLARGNIEEQSVPV